MIRTPFNGGGIPCAAEVLLEDIELPGTAARTLFHLRIVKRHARIE